MEKVSSSTRGAQDEVERLRQQHRQLEERLAALDRHLALTPDEQIERSRLKKEKLLVKDRMLRLGAIKTGTT